MKYEPVSVELWTAVCLFEWGKTVFSFRWGEERDGAEAVYLVLKLMGGRREEKRCLENAFSFEETPS